MTDELLVEALATIDRLDARLIEAEKQLHEPIAIVGMGCRFPQADGLAAFWSLLRTGKDASREITRWKLDSFYDGGKSVTKRASLLSRIDELEPAAFQITPREAEAMDPQQRLLLEVAYEAMEDAALSLPTLQGLSTGVFVGIGPSDYLRLDPETPPEVVQYASIGNLPSVAAGRISYVFGLSGPCIALDTACSSSLVAVHTACESLRLRTSDVALAGGVSVLSSPGGFIALSSLNALAPDGRCKAWDASADGYGRGEGCGMIVLKRLSDARRDGDRIWAVIRGSAINSDGRSSGLTAPNPQAQERVIRAALARSGHEPAAVQYIEAHGTGTVLGDPIEVEALASVFAQRATPLAIGTVKTNIGHLEASAGIADLIKTALALHHRELPASLHVKTLNPHIDWDAIPIRVRTDGGAWPDPSAPLVAGISSFGLSGTNSHVILEEAPVQVAPVARDGAPRALLLSAHTTESLTELARRLADTLERRPDEDLHVVHTAARRTQLDQRVAIIGRDASEWTTRLRAFARGEATKYIAAGQVEGTPRVVFVFPGQGSQWLGMGRDLFEHDPSFRRVIEACDAGMRRYTDWSLIDELRAPPETSRMADIDVVQPMLFAMQVGLAASLGSWGIRPYAVLGHSMGEIAAACVAEALSLDDAIRVMCTRANLLRRVRGRGAMALVELELEKTRAAIAPYGTHLSIAANNGPRSTVVSGSAPQVAELVESLKQREVFARIIRVDFASHSSQVDELEHDLVAQIGSIAPRRATTRFVSTATDGEPVLDAQYWWRNLRDPVQFASRVQQLSSAARTVFVEISAHPVLTTSIAETVQASGVVLGSLRRDEPEREVLLESIGAIHCAGYPVDWTRQAIANARVVDLPSYPWHRQRYWMEQVQRPREQIAPLIHRRTELPHAPGTHLLELDLDLADRKLAYLAEHEVASEPWLPGSAIVELAYQAAALVYGVRAVALEDIAFERAIVLSRTEPLRIQIIVSPDHEIQLFSSGVRHARARVRVDAPCSAERMSLSTIQQECTDRASLDAMYAAMAAGGVSYGPAFRVLTDVRSTNGEALGKLCDLRVDRGYVLHPALLDAGVQVLGVAAASAASDREAVVATGVGEVVVHGGGNPTWIHARSRRENGGTIGDIAILDAAGGVIASATGFRFAAASSIAPHDKLDRMMQTTTWHVEERGASRTLDGTTLLFANDDRVRLVLEARGAHVVTVRAGTSYVQRDATHFEVSPDTKADFARLFEAVTPTRVIYLWGADLAADDVENVERLACRAVVYLVQGLVASGTDLPALALVTSGAQPVRDSGSNAAQMPLWGLGASLVHELPELHTRLVDLDPASPLSLVDELTASNHADRVALRGSERLVPRLERYERVATAATIRPDRTYLITGGLGGLGLVAARRLVQLGARHLALLGRSAPPTSVQREIDALGAQTVRADVADESQLATAFAKIAAAMPPLAGVIHAAGVSDDAVVINLDAAKIHNVLAPKVHGAWNLHRLTEHLALDFFVSFGSGSAVLGAPGIAHYAAANAFLDGLAHYRKHRGLPAMTIDWSGWAEVGMATRPEVAANIKNQGGALLSTADGSELLERLLAEPVPQVSVLAVDRSRAIVASREPLVDAVRAATTEALRLEALQAYLRAAIAKVTRLAPESVKADVAFATLGVDSLMMITVKNAIERELGCTISTATLYAKPTLRALATFLLTKFFAAATGEPSHVATAPALPSSELPVDVDDMLADLKNRGYLDE